MPKTKQVTKQVSTRAIKTAEKREVGETKKEQTAEKQAVDRVENYEVADIFDRVADFLELLDENPFRIRAYRNAARVVRGLATPLWKLIEEGADLDKLPGIGKDLAGKIQEIVKTGTLTQLHELQAKLPPSLVQLMELPGLGPKKAMALYRELKIETVEQLKEAAQAGKIAGIRGFGKKTEENILQSIEQFQKQSGRFLLSEADQHVVPLLEYMRKAPGIERVEAAGSYRRRKETVGDIDILAIGKQADSIVEHFTKYPKISKVLAAGGTKATVILGSGLQVDLRVLPRESYGAALCYFTGSKEHNIALRKLALEKNLRVSEYGVFKLKGKRQTGTMIAGKEEKDVYAALGLAWIPPEMRENNGEIELAAKNALPKLIELDDIRGDLQMHTKWSDGKNTIEEMVEACIELGYEYMAISDHSKALAMTKGLGPKELKQQFKEIAKVQKKHPKIKILRSLEVDIHADGTLDLDDESLAALDLVVVSVHSRFNLPYAQQTERILKAIQHPETNILGHPTGRLLGQRPPMEFDVEKVLKAAKEYNVAVEINAQPERLDLMDNYIRVARELGVKMIINTDAHSVSELRMMHYGVEQARRGWLEKKHVLNTQSFDSFMKSFKK
ncbi:MAG TPA: DNA polymerase/3'-5' exonuclease PolX [Fimbriimonadales bacterium]|nr:DNA polymerase/3'-5' exonuclease PolX [Fimbriimonadales bacterium]